MTKQEYINQKQEEKSKQSLLNQETKQKKIMHYILPINPFPYNKITNYVILKVEVVKPGIEDILMCKVLEVIREESGNGYYTYCMKQNFEIGCSKEHLYPINNKFNKEKNDE